MSKTVKGMGELGPVKMIKIQQTEAAPFNTDNNLCSIRMDADNVSDLGRSYLDMKVVIKDTDEQVRDDVTMGDYTSEVKYMGSSLIKTVTLRSEAVGVVEQVRAQNVLSETMKQYYKYSQEEASAAVLNNGKVDVDANGLAHIIVPLKDILGCAHADQPFPNNRMGPTNLELEFENVKPIFYTKEAGLDGAYTFPCANIAANPAAAQQVATFALTYGFPSMAVAQDYLRTGKTVNLTYTPTGGAAVTVPKVIQQVTVAAGVYSVQFTEPIELAINVGAAAITVSATYGPPVYQVTNIPNGGAQPLAVTQIVVNTADLTAFNIGQTIFVGFFEQTTAGAQPNDVFKIGEAEIADIEEGEAQDTILITFDTPLSVTIEAAHTLTQGFIFKELEPELLNWTIQDCSLVLVKPIQQVSVPVYEFKTHNLEMANLGAGSPFFRKQYELETTCDLTLLINPTTTLCGARQFGKYRNSINSVNTTTMDVSLDVGVNGSLYYDRVIYCLDSVKRLISDNNGSVVVCIPELIVPQATGLPNNVVEYDLFEPTGAVAASVVYVYKRIMKSF